MRLKVLSLHVTQLWKTPRVKMQSGVRATWSEAPDFATRSSGRCSQTATTTRASGPSSHQDPVYLCLESEHTHNHTHTHLVRTVGSALTSHLAAVMSKCDAAVAVRVFISFLLRRLLSGISPIRGLKAVVRETGGHQLLEVSKKKTL